MALEIGWISVYRQITSGWLWKDKPFSMGQAWIDLILLANHKDGKTPLNGQLITIKRGQHMTSEYKLAERWGWDRKKVRSFLGLLEQDEMIIKTIIPKVCTIIEISNYNKYQNRPTEGTTPSVDNTGDSEESGTTNSTTEGLPKDYGRTTQGLHRDLNNNDNNDNNVNNEKKKKNNNLSAEPTIYEQIKEIFNNTCVTLPKIKDITNNRKKALKTRIDEKKDIEYFKEVFTKVNQSDFLSGRDDKWKGCCFDWIIKPANLQKIVEGNYDNKGDKDNGENRGQNNGNGEVRYSFKKYGAKE
jgi:DNA replication protein DnaD